MARGQLFILHCCVTSKSRISDAVYAATEPERHRKEVEYVANHNGEWIKNYLEEVHKKRGFESYKKLRDDVEKEYRKNKKRIKKE